MLTTVIVGLVALVAGAIIETTPLRPINRLVVAVLGLVGDAGDKADQTKEKLKK